MSEARKRLLVRCDKSVELGRPMTVAKAPLTSAEVDELLKGNEVAVVYGDMISFDWFTKDMPRHWSATGIDVIDQMSFMRVDELKDGDLVLLVEDSASSLWTIGVPARTSSDNLCLGSGDPPFSGRIVGGPSAPNEDRWTGIQSPPRDEDLNQYNEHQ